MKNTLQTFLIMLLNAGIICAQTTKESDAKILPANSKSTAASTTKKRPDLNNLVKLTGQPAPAFAAADIGGTEYKLENLRGKIVVINLWATWCEPCVAEMPELNALVEKFKDETIVFLAATDEKKIVAESFLQKRQFLYQVLPDALNVIRLYSPQEKPDPVNGKSRSINALPTHIVIDRDGIVVKHVWGYGRRTVSELSQTIEKSLAQPNKQ